jgi:hypothetical protein
MNRKVSSTPNGHGDTVAGRSPRRAAGPAASSVQVRVEDLVRPDPSQPAIKPALVGLAGPLQRDPNHALAADFFEEVK